MSRYRCEVIDGIQIRSSKTRGEVAIEHKGQTVVAVKNYCLRCDALLELIYDAVKHDDFAEAKFLASKREKICPPENHRR